MAGEFAAIRVLHCECSFDTGSNMLLFRTRKGELTECPNGHGQQKTKEVRSGKRRFVWDCVPFNRKGAIMI